jgi:homogentisate 1,2-dioxygenase
MASHRAGSASDEVLYYASSEFMSRKGSEYGSVTLHPDGLPHGPHPGRAEASIGQARTDELAVMVDTFRPLFVSADAISVEDPDYRRSWLDERSYVRHRQRDRRADARVDRPDLPRVAVRRRGC